MNVMLKGEKIVKAYKGQSVLNDLSISVASGEIYGLIGPSGSGKTTLIKVLLGLEKLTKGEVALFGQKPSIPAFHHLGYMAQSDALYEELTCEENLDFFASIQGLRARQKKERIREVAKVVHLENDLQKRVLHFSGGMKRRLSLACALLHQPKLYILDEPTVGLDPIIRQSLWSLFHELKTEGAAIIVTTHVMDEVYRCDRVGLLKAGKLLAEGSPEDLLQTYHVDNIEAIFMREEEGV